MSKINFITGELEGRLGEIVGSRHRGTYYTKRFTPPTNPDTINQHDSRSAFSHITKLGSLLYPEILKPYLYPKSLKGTDINTLVKNNERMIKSHVWTPVVFKIGEGGLTGGGTVTFTRTNTNFKVTWLDNLGGGNEDEALFIVFDETTNKIAYRVRHRDDTDASVDFALLDFTKVYGYLFFSKQIIEGKKGICSTTYATKFT